MEVAGPEVKVSMQTLNEGLEARGWMCTGATGGGTHAQAHTSTRDGGAGRTGGLTGAEVDAAGSRGPFQDAGLGGAPGAAATAQLPGIAAPQRTAGSSAGDATGGAATAVSAFAAAVAQPPPVSPASSPAGGSGADVSDSVGGSPRGMTPRGSGHVSPSPPEGAALAEPNALQGPPHCPTPLLGLPWRDRLSPTTAAPGWGVGARARRGWRCGGAAVAGLPPTPNEAVGHSPRAAVLRRAASLPLQGHRVHVQYRRKWRERTLARKVGPSPVGGAWVLRDTDTAATPELPHLYRGATTAVVVGAGGIGGGSSSGRGNSAASGELRTNVAQLL